MDRQPQRAKIKSAEQGKRGGVLWPECVASDVESNQIRPNPTKKIEWRSIGGLEWWEMKSRQKRVGEWNSQASRLRSHQSVRPVPSESGLVVPNRVLKVIRA